MNEKVKSTSFVLLAAVLLIVIVICCSYCVRSCHQVIDQAGGLREMVIQEGKTVRSIYKDINDDNYKFGG